MRAGLLALLQFVGDEPQLGSLLVVDALGAGPRVLERRARQLDIMKGIVDKGRGETKAGGGPPSLMAEGVVGAVLSVIHARLLEQSTHSPASNGSSARARGAPGSLIGLLNQLMGMIVLPYLGRAAAARELARPAPKLPRRTPNSTTGDPRDEPSRDPLEGLDMRLTYRTLLVLSAIAAKSGASNRQIAEQAGVHDQGQISKLLGRLERLGLVNNTGLGHVKGEPNAWKLTRRGEEVERATRVQASATPAGGPHLTPEGFVPSSA